MRRFEAPVEAEVVVVVVAMARLVIVDAGGGAKRLARDDRMDG